MVSPIMALGQRRRTVYLPGEGTSTEVRSGEVHKGGERVGCDTPLEHLPVFVREGRGLAMFTPERGS